MNKKKRLKNEYPKWERECAVDLTFKHVFKTIMVVLVISVLSGIGYWALFVKKPEIETKFKKHENEIKWLEEELIEKTAEVQRLKTNIALFAERDNLITAPENQEKEIKLLEEKLGEKTAEVQRLETIIAPFRTIALEHFTGDEKEALMKLARHIKTLEKKSGKREFIPLSVDIRTQIVKQLTGLQQLYKDNDIHIELTHEKFIPPTTRKYAKQLALILADSGLNVTGPGFAKVVYPDNQSYPLFWSYNKEQEELIDKLYIFLNEIQTCKSVAARKDFSKGHVRIHMAGDVIFDSQGRVLFE